MATKAAHNDRTQEYETDGRLDLARRLGCSARLIRPCLVDAYERPTEFYASRKMLAHHTRAFVAYELFTLIGNGRKAAGELRAWGKDKGTPQEQIRALLHWMEREAWRRKGCDGRPAPRQLCCGKANCDWYADKRWEQGTCPRPDASLAIFNARRWDRYLSDAALRIYSALCDFEQDSHVPPGEDLFFSARVGLEYTKMRPARQGRALKDLEAAGLIRIVRRGKPRTADEKVQTRTVQRVIPIPSPAK
jgi:hypothetical protein